MWRSFIRVKPFSHGLDIIISGVMFRLNHNNKKVMAPPAELPDNPGLPVIVVASVMRSGTHLLIDTILNNFSGYKNKPLYVDLDEWIRSGRSIDDIYTLEGAVIKTHYPQAKLALKPEELERLFQNCKVIMPIREEESVWKSSTSSAFDVYSSKDDFNKDMEAFNSFWSKFATLKVSFADVVTDDFDGALQRISRFIGIEGLTKGIKPIPKNQKYKVLSYKLLTRMLGRQSPIINTTIGFAKK